MVSLTHTADDIIEEAELMKSFSDEHILQVIGLVSNSAPLMMITEPVLESLQHHCRNLVYLEENEIILIVVQVHVLKNSRSLICYEIYFIEIYHSTNDA